MCRVVVAVGITAILAGLPVVRNAMTRLDLCWTTRTRLPSRARPAGSSGCGDRRVSRPMLRFGGRLKITPLSFNNKPDDEAEMCVVRAKGSSSSSIKSIKLIKPTKSMKYL